jgi:plastocyanin
MIRPGVRADSTSMSLIGSRSRPFALALAGVSSLALLAGCGSSGSGSYSGGSAPMGAATTAAAATGTAAAKSGTVAITYKDYAIAPADVTVKAGSKLVWTNEDATTHNVIVKDGAPAPYTSKDFTKGQTATFTPTRPGVYKYLCTFHAGSMQGSITVVG